MILCETQPADIIFCPPDLCSTDLSYILDAIHDSGYEKAINRDALTLLWVQIYCQKIGAWVRFGHAEFHHVMIRHPVYLRQVVKGCVPSGFNPSIYLRKLADHGLLVRIDNEPIYQITSQGIVCLDKAWDWCRGPRRGPGQLPA